MQHNFIRYYPIFALFGGALLCMSESFSGSTEDETEQFDLVPLAKAQEGHAVENTNHSKGMISRATLYEKMLSIEEIIVRGQQLVPLYTILSKVPYRAGDILLRSKTRQLIQNIYQLGLVSCVSVGVESGSTAHKIKLIITIVEKRPIQRIILEGAVALSKSFINKKLDLASIQAMDEGDFYSIGDRIKKLYKEKNYHSVAIKGAFQISAEGDTEAVFTIKEGDVTRVRRVFFEGNRIFKDVELRKLLFTREDWLFGFLDRAGTYQPDALEYDRSVIENYYQNHGYLTARVVKVITEPIENSSDVAVTFTIHEGEQYRFGKISAAENQLFSEAEQLSIIPFRTGDIYSKELIKNALEMLRMLVGEHGYIYAEVQPSLIPDAEKRTVDLAFSTHLGSPIRLNRITIIGNARTDDATIRRQIVIDEGELITTRIMELSKMRVQGLGYFDQKNGVNWNIVRVDENSADLELMLKEIKTGSFFIQSGFNGNLGEMTSFLNGFKFTGGVQDTNWGGRGLQGGLSITYSGQECSIDANVADQWFLSRPLYGALNSFYRVSQREKVHFSTKTPVESTAGLFGKLGFPVSFVDALQVSGELGIESIKWGDLEVENKELNRLVQRRFISGNALTIAGSMVQDMRNHPIYPTMGYLWNIGVKVALPYTLRANDFGFAKAQGDFQWYTPLVDAYNLIFRFHAGVGFVHQIKEYVIPYRELFHVGGSATVRGFAFGQASPAFGTSALGGTKSLVINAELLFPIKLDGSIRGVLFYDGGSGWDTPDIALVPKTEQLHNNSFDYRHAIGFGLRLTKPMPLLLNVGFKLDRRKRLGEKLMEIDFNMTQDF